MTSMLEDFQALVTDLESGVFDPSTRPVDILFAYRLLLFRNPEMMGFEDLKARTEEFQRVYELTRGFMSSEEFRRTHYQVSSRPDGRIVLARHGNLRIAVHLDDIAISGCVINGTYEPEMQWLIGALVRPGMICVDLGANIGFLTAIMGEAVGPGGRVYSFEPFPKVFHMLSITVEESRLGDRVTTIPKACSDQPGTAQLNFVTQSDNFGGSHISVGDTEVSTVAGLTTVKIPLTTLDMELAGSPRIDFIKIDIEGSEVRALRGMVGKLRSDRPTLVMEINPEGLAVQGTTVAELLTLLHESDYRSFLVSGLYQGTLEEVGTGDAGRFPGGTFENIVCFPKEQAEVAVTALKQISPHKAEAINSVSEESLTAAH